MFRTIDDLVTDVLKHAGALYKASEAVRYATARLVEHIVDDESQIGILDMLWSFAHTAIGARFSYLG